MGISYIIPWPRMTVHDTYREGARLGLIMGTVTWLWVALVDVVTGSPFHTFTALGGIFIFTVVHYLLNMTYGVVLLSVVHGAERTPSLIMGMLFVFITLQGGIAMFTGVLVQMSLGSVGWVAILGGNFIATVIAFVLISRTHPLLEHLHRAENED